MIKKLKDNIIGILTAVGIFATGAVGYGFTEILWRGYTHPSMLAAGGLAFSLIFIFNVRFKNASLIMKSALCTAVIITTELLFGLIFNMLLGMNVWDYSYKKYNFYGQICLEYTVYWFVLSLIICSVFSVISDKRHPPENQEDVK